MWLSVVTSGTARGKHKNRTQLAVLSMEEFDLGQFDIIHPSLSAQPSCGDH